jgi:hypothetical protein
VQAEAPVQPPTRTEGHALQWLHAPQVSLLTSVLPVVCAATEVGVSRASEGIQIGGRVATLVKQILYDHTV